MTQSMVEAENRRLEKDFALGGFFCDFDRRIFAVGLWLSGYIA
jgi:hypothetical protein